MTFKKLGVHLELLDSQNLIVIEHGNNAEEDLIQKKINIIYKMTH